MALSAGSVTVAPDGTVSGSGYAFTLYGIERDATSLPALLDGAATAAVAASQVGEPFTEDAVLSYRQKVAAKCEALAAAHVAFVQTASVTVLVPSTPITITNGTVS